MRVRWTTVMVMLLCVTGACGGPGQPAGGSQPAGQAATPPAASQKSTARMATDIPAAIVTPASLETRLGTLRFTDGFPDDATVTKVFDNLDFQRGVQRFSPPCRRRH